jgi:hypothetical protein
MGGRCRYRKKAVALDALDGKKLLVVEIFILFKLGAEAVVSNAYNQHAIKYLYFW